MYGHGLMGPFNSRISPALWGEQGTYEPGVSRGHGFFKVPRSSWPYFWPFPGSLSIGHTLGAPSKRLMNYQVFKMPFPHVEVCLLREHYSQSFRFSVFGLSCRPSRHPILGSCCACFCRVDTGWAKHHNHLSSSLDIFGLRQS